MRGVRQSEALTIARRGGPEEELVFQHRLLFNPGRVRDSISFSDSAGLDTGARRSANLSHLEANFDGYEKLGVAEMLHLGDAKRLNPWLRETCSS